MLGMNTNSQAFFEAAARIGRVEEPVAQLSTAEVWRSVDN